MHSAPPSYNEGYVKIEFPETTGENPIVEGDKVTINYTPENTDGTAGTPTTLTYTYTGGNWVQDEKDSLKLTPTTENGKVSVTIPEDKVADKTSVSATTTDVAGHTSAESETSKKDAPFDVKSDKPVITSIKAIDTSTTADKDPERVIIEGTSTEADGTKVYLYKEGQTNGQPIAETTVTSGKFKFDISESTATPLAVGDRFVATVQTFAGDKATEEVSQPSEALAVPEVKLGKHDDNNVTNSGGHKGDETAPAKAPTLEALTDDTNLGAVKVKLPEDAKDGDRVIVKFTPESATTTPATPVEVTLTKGANGWTSDKPDLIANPVNGNEVTIEKDKVKDNTEVTAVIKDLADNEKAASPNATAYPNERTKLESNVTLEKAIDTDAISNATPEKFTIKGTAEKDATVTATIALPNGEKVVIGTFKVTQDNGEFTFDTNSIREGDLKEKLKDFTFNTNGSATPITVEATKEGKAPSHAQTVNAKAAAKGVKEDHTETTAPDNPTITPYMEGFGGAKVELPVAQAGEQLEMTLTLTPNAENGTTAGTPETAKTAKLVNNGSGWSVEGTNELVTIKEIGGKKFVVISGEKAPNGGKLTAEIKDFAGNKADAKVNNDKGELQANTKEATLSKAAGDDVVGRTDPPIITAGSDNDAGDIVATPGADNTKMVVTYVDQNGQSKTITVVKDMDAGEWKVEGDKPETVIVDPKTGKITVPADLAKDGEEAKAVGFKDNDDPLGSEKPYTQSYTHSDGTQGTFDVVDEKKITVNASDKTVNAADPVTFTALTEKFSGAATVKGGTDNVKVEMVVTGYVDETGQITTKEKAATTNGTNGEKDLILFAIKDPKTNEWTVVGTTKEKYEAADAKDKDVILSPISNDIATVAADGTITLKANALKDNSAVKAKGYDALGNSNPNSDYQSQTVGADPVNKDVDADEPYVPVTGGDGSMTAKPGEDNTSMKVTFTKDKQEKTLEIVKEDSTNKWKVKEGSQITANNDAAVGEDGQITLSNGAKLNPNTGEVYFPAGTVDIESQFKAVGKNKDDYESESVSQPVLEDPTSYAEAPIAVVEGNKVVVTPGADSKSITLKGTNLNTEPVIKKGSNGEWAIEGNSIDGISVDAKTGKVTIDSSKIADGKGIVAEAKDGWKPEANIAQSNGGQGVRPMILDNDANSTEAPDIQTHTSGEKQGSVDITPKSDHNSVTVNYKDEQDKAQSITATRNPETGEWSLQPIVTTDEQGNTVVTPVPASKATIDPSTGVISLKADELKDGENITATGRDVNGNSKSTEESDATKAPNDPEGTKLPESEQPTDVPEVPATPPTPPQAETPTLFENVSIGKVKITPGQGVDYLSFKVQVDTREGGTGQIPQQNTYLHYVLVKNDSNGWDQFVYKITDLNDNGSIDETGDRFENVTNDPNTMKLVEESGVFTLSEKQFNQGNLDMRTRLGAVLADKVEQNDKTDKIFDIVIGREGSETITLPNSNGKTNNTTLSDKGEVKDFTLIKANEFEAYTNTPSNLSKAPMYQHMLSTGEELTAPVFTVKKVNGKTEIEVLVDENNQAVGFELSSYTRGSFNFQEHYLTKKNNSEWIDTASSGGETLVERDNNLDGNGKIGFRIKSKDGWNLSVDDTKWIDSTPGNHWQLKNIIYGAKKSADPTGMDKFYPITVTEDGTYTASESKPIALPLIDLRNPDATVTTKPPMPELPPQPSQPAETVNEPSATQDNSKQGGVKVKPAESNGGSKYSVNYVDEATGQSKVINVKKEGGQWKFDSQGSTGVIDNTKIKLDPQTGELTFAPEAVRDGGKVTITAYDSQGSARAQKDVVAADEPTIVSLIHDRTSENIGGAKATPETGTNKFKLTFTDEGNNINVSAPTAHNVVYQKVNGSWKVVEVDGKQGSTIKINGVDVDLNTSNGYLTVNSSTGEVTIDRNSLKDGSTVSMIPYSKRGTESSGNAKTITTEKDKLVTALDDTSQNLSQLRGTDHAWGEVAINGNGSYVYGLAQLVHGKRHDGSTTNNAKATVTPLTQQENAATVSNNKGKRLNYSDNNDVVKIGERVMNKWTWDPTLKFDFKNGDDILAVGHDLGYGDNGYSGLKSEYEHWQKVADRYRVQVDMGAGNDILAVGFHDNAWDVIKHREAGFLAIHKQSGNIHNYEKVNFLNSGEPNGGQLAGAKVFMGEGNDTVLLKGTWYSGNWQRASKNSIIDLGEGDNRLVLTPDSGHGRALSSTKVNAGSGNDVVTGDTFFESSEIYLGGGSDEFIAAFVENTTVDLGHGDDWAEVSRNIGSGAKILLGAGNDVFEMKAGLSPNNSRVDGGSGVDTLLISRDGAHITNHNMKGFENVGFKANNITFGIRADYFGLIEGPMKISKANNVINAKVDLGMNGDMRSNVSNNTNDRADGSYRWTHKSTAAEGDKTYDVYEYVVAPKHQVWIEQGITVL
ncbi:hypothetical protein [Glaesserella parasuis]|uniref:hypothetical protein n=1 Tax=Glaesserella parasuis TaxID=738 RepID=UPI003B67C9F1